MTKEKNNKSESKEEQLEKDRRFDPELLKKGLQCDLDQYDRLIKCSKKGPEGIAEWNQWRRGNPDEKIWLQGAKLGSINLQEAELYGANLQGASFFGAKLQGAILNASNLQEADLRGASLQGAYLKEADLQGANLISARLQGAHFDCANLQVAKLLFTKLQGATLEGAELQGANLHDANLQGAKLREVFVDGSTSFLDCKIDKNTDFRNTGMENVLIKSGIKILLKYNIRRMNWQDWYAKHRFLQWPVKLFWSMSKYGISTGRIMLTFLILAIAFAFVYSLWPCCVLVNNVVGDIRGFVHALYFSVVTMTTLGFGDIAANPDSWQGQVVLMVQVILGYVLLGALVTRLAVLFTSDGPAGSFTPMDKETKELLAKLKEDKSN